MEQIAMREEWRYVLTTHGQQSVTMNGDWKKLLLCVTNQDSPTQVRIVSVVVDPSRNST